ncbi:MAG: thioredoxin-disulfide reductase [Campylobacterales bacterium]
MLDLAIIGGGPAGLSAGLYATRGGMEQVVMFEKGMPGGAITQSSEVENYPGVSEVLTGIELMEKWPEQCQRFGLKHEMDEVTKLAINSDGTFKLSSASGSEYHSYSVIIATGGRPRKAGFIGEDKFLGRGVSTCATCDGFFYKGKDVAVIGGGDTALEEALYLAKICNKVFLIHRRDEFRAAPSIVDRIKTTPNIELVLDSEVLEAMGDMSGLNSLKVRNKTSKVERVLDVPGAFVFVGYDVNNELLKDDSGSFMCAVNEAGEVIVDLSMRTSVEGLYAAGDMRNFAPKQVVCAASDGTIAALQAIAYVDSKKEG